MLQCTAYTEVPEIDAIVALTTMQGGPDNPPDALAVDDFLLCELGEHGEHTEHAAQLWTAEIPAVRDLWLFWRDTGTHRTYRFAELPPCLAMNHRLSVANRQGCIFFDRHPAVHSWDVTDPLVDLLTERARQELQHYRDADDQGSAD
ncbi:hypothetical protein [Streptomyces platensis]